MVKGQHSCGGGEPTFEFARPGAEERLAELIIYIAQKCEDDKYFGATVLNKVLWNADTFSYAFYGEPITGVAYQSLPQGPAPKRLLPVKMRLLANEDIVEIKRNLGRRQQHRIIPRREPNLDVFSARDIAVVDRIIEYLRDRSAVQVSEMSHIRAWRIAGAKGLIPYEAIFLSDEDITEYDVVRTHELNRDHGWEAV